MHVRNQKCATAAFQEKQEANLKISTHAIENKHPFNPLNRIEDGVSDVNPRNCRTKAKDCELNQRHQLQTEDDNCSLSAWEWNREHAVEFQDSSVDDNSVFLCHFWTNFCQLVLVEVLGRVRKWVELWRK